MVQISFEIPEGVLATRHQNAESFTREMRLAAAVTWYAQGTVSQGRAAEIAGMPRSEFIETLARFGVSPFQYSAEEIIDEATRG